MKTKICIYCLTYVASAVYGFKIFKMADIYEAPVSSSCNPCVVRNETFVNQFRIAFVDQCCRTVDWTFQCGEPVWYSNDNGTSGYTTIKDISRAGIFTVHSAPAVKNEITLASKYVCYDET